MSRLGWRVHHWMWPIVWWARRKPRSDVRQTVWSWADYLDMRFRVFPMWRRIRKRVELVSEVRLLTGTVEALSAEREADQQELSDLSTEVRKLSTERYEAVRRAYGIEAQARGAADNEVRRLREALKQIAEMPTSELNPDGEEQAAHSMQLVAESALAPTTAR